MPVFIAVALLLWLVIGAIVVILVCPLLKEHADRRRAPRDPVDIFLPARHPIERPSITINKEVR